MASQWAREKHPSPETSRPGQRRPRRQVLSRQNEIYDDLLVDVLSHSQDERRPLKRRKSQRQPSEVILIDDQSSEDARAAPSGDKDVVIIDSSTDVSEGEDDEVEWDTVELTAVPFSGNVAENEISTAREVTLASTPQKAS
jgi:hypothetical protein